MTFSVENMEHYYKGKLFLGCPLYNQITMYSSTTNTLPGFALKHTTRLHIFLAYSVTDA